MSKNAKELFSGVIHKCGGKVKSWNRRWMVLRSDYCLYYYKDTAKGHLGAISLRDPKFSIRVGEKGDCSWPKQCQPGTRLTIVTSPRVYFMYTDNDSEAQEWKRVLTSARDNLVEDSYRSNKLFSSRATSSVSEEDTKPKDQKRKSSAPVITTHGANSYKPEEYEQIYSSPTEVKEFKLPSSATGKEGNGSAETEGEIEGFYDMAKPERSLTAVYDDVDFEHLRKKEAPPKDNQAPVVLNDKPPSPEQPLYEEPPVDDSTQPVYEEAPDIPVSPKSPLVQKQESVVYECLGAEEVVTNSVSSSIQRQPLPPIPISRELSTTSQPLYEDMQGGGVLYEDIDTSKIRIMEASVSVEDNTRSSAAAPSLPPKDDAPPPPLPPKEDLPPLPPREDPNAPALPPKDNSSTPPLRSKQDAHTPPLPSKEHSKTPPSPSKHAHSPPLPSKNAHTPPLPLKEATDLPPPKEISSPNRERKSADRPVPHQRSIAPTPSPELARRRSPSPKPRAGSSGAVEARTPSPVPRRRNNPPSPATQPQRRESNSPTAGRRTEGLSNDRESAGKSQANTNGEKEVKITITPPTVRRQSQSPVDNGHSNGISSEPKESPTTTTTVPPVKDGDKGGMALFRKRHERVQEMEHTDIKQRAQTIQILENVTSDPALSLDEKAMFAETLREVEQERLKASEERFHWERERMKFEEERRKFEQEKKKLMSELDRTRQQV